MLRAVQPLKNLVYASALGAFVSGNFAPTAVAEGTPNPYQAIVARNPFGLKPPLVEERTVPPPVIPPSKVLLTGITSLLGLRAFLEITEQEPGKAATTRKPILREGEKDGSVEVVSIDPEKGVVKIRNAGIESTIVFETPKLSASAPAPGAGAPAGAAPAPIAPAPAASAPMVISPSSAANNPGRGNGSGVTIIGGGSSGSSGLTLASSSTGFRGGSPSVSTFGGGAYSPVGASANVNVSGGLNTSSSRQLRTDPSTPVNLAAPIDGEQQMRNTLKQRETFLRAGLPYPPLPYLPQNQNQPNQN